MFFSASKRKLEVVFSVVSSAFSVPIAREEQADLVRAVTAFAYVLLWTVSVEEPGYESSSFFR